MSDYNDYEWEFMQDSIEKKRIARGASHKASRKKGFKGAMKTPIDNLRGKARRAYMNENTTTGILSYLEFKDLELPQRAKVMVHLLQKYSRAQLCAAWGITPAVLSGTIYRMKKASPDLVDKLGGPIKATVKSQENMPTTPTLIPLTEVIARNFVFSLSVNGDFTGADLSGRFLNIASLLSPDKKYHASLQIMELED